MDRWLERSKREEDRESDTDIGSESQRNASEGRFSRSRSRSRRGNSYVGSAVSEDGLSIREVGTLKRWMKVKEKEE